jgi:non-canonical (house-cleaning) NTP pyrophosphatase
MIKIVVGSKNPVKISAAQTAICDVLSLKEVECVGINAPSSVAEQPMTTEETKRGAVNRIQYCQQHIRADFYIAIEGGVDQFEYGPATFALRHLSSP